MTESGDEVRFISGDERLARILADPQRRARVDAITAEMDLIDQRYRTAAQLLDDAVPRQPQRSAPARPPRSSPHSSVTSPPRASARSASRSHSAITT
ncbi:MULTISPECIES: hypothetical protein [Tsukamurella]|uniref:Uncharacterized protein n=6 Tax=Tsukamurella TaxID=2060 RepID=A0ABS5NAL1_TSUPA|nr:MULTISPECIES: hypothetical protein [Tsukamurella]MBS4101304.1 hypothetical protein [Tsukamurella paurometabola]MCA4997607.1 hypothetical protein [Tsukamurella tyrosinosolvens]MEC4614394.1 hypothetical protein [Tsukamurella tyrosinosolvens]NMD55965.1 hypothetical protein [Tsukamurella columbiensis]TWS20905.1 hypothetical protein FK529_06230 [Tsukamurella asaccharolytica]